jgi:integrase
VATTVREAIEEYGRDTSRERAAIVRRFVEREGWHEDASAALRHHLRDLEAEGLAPGTVDLAYRTVRAFYRRLGLRPPRVAGHHYDPRDSRRPALSPDVIARLVAAAKSGAPGPYPIALLALSTTYGLRAVELARVRSTDVDPGNERLFVRTAKGGPMRWMWLPPAIANWLVTDWPLTDEDDVELLFGELWDSAIDAERPRGVAWHAIRRALHRDLAAAGVGESDRRRFGRWASRRDMASLYAEPNLVVGEKTVRPAIDPSDEGRREYDLAAWERHPYLALWSG